MIGFLIEETGECGERELNHSDGEAERFYRELKRERSQCAGGDGGHRAYTLVRAATRRARFRVVDWRSGRDQDEASPEEENRPRGRPTHVLKLLLENRFPRIWVPSPENRDLRQLLWHRHRLVADADADHESAAGRGDE